VSPSEEGLWRKKEGGTCRLKGYELREKMCYPLGRWGTQRGTGISISKLGTTNGQLRC